jgi:DNA-binding winged helix-turn-helix (wHTH) protein/tetratricopeptide (TPR) repeat protein
MHHDLGRRVRFGPFLFDLESGELWRGEAPLKLQPQPARLLALLVRHAGRVVDREAIQDHLWGDAAVDAEAGVNFAVRRVREALGERAGESLYVKTLPRRGYRFVAPIEAVPATLREVLREVPATLREVPATLREVPATLPPSEVPATLRERSPAPRSGWRPGLVMGGLLLLVLGAVHPELHQTEVTDEAVSSVPAARDAYLRGRYLLQQEGVQAHPRAAKFFRRALAEDPTFAAAYVALEVTSREALSLGEREALLDQALEIAPEMAEAHLGKGWVALAGFQPELAREAFERARSLDGRLVEAYHGSALAHAALGEREMAMARIERGLEMDPGGSLIQGDAALVYFWAGRPTEAIAHLEDSLELLPEARDVRWAAGTYLAAAGRWRLAVEVTRPLIHSNSTRRPVPVPAGAGEAVWRRRALSFYQGAVEYFLDHGEPVPAGSLAECYLLLGRDDDALTWLERAAEEGWYGINYLGIDLRWDPVRREPRFQELLARFGVEDHRLTP